MIKKFYRHTNKRDVATALTKQERRRTLIQRQLGNHTSQEFTAEVVSPDEFESLSDLHHIMRALPCNIFDLANVLSENQLDPAVKVRYFECAVYPSLNSLTELCTKNERPSSIPTSQLRV